MRHKLRQLQWASYARYLSLSRAPILCGPWRSEVGFECLYWVPFLQKFRTQYKIDPNRLIAVGRGGSGQWYQMAGHGDIYEHLPVETVRTFSLRASQQTGSQKAYTVEGWEPHVCGLVAESLGIERYHVLSPSWMYQLLDPWWHGQATEALLHRYTLQPMRYPPPPIDHALQAKLPEKFMAMRWYARPTWPYREDLNLWTRKFVERIAQQMPVVLIDSFHADDHADIHLGDIPNVLRLSDLVEQTPTDSLLIQSSVIARAQAYVGTYGGMAQGAMRWGVPTVALYAEFGQTAPAHLTLTQSLSLRTGVPFLLVQPKDVDGALSMILGANMRSPQRGEAA